MADTAVAITAGSGTNIDTRTEGGNGNHRQVVVLGDPATNAGVAPVDATAGLKVNLGADNDVTNAGTFAVQVDAALPAGTNAIGKLSANSGVDIGDVDVTSSALPTGAATAANQQTDALTDTELRATAVDVDTELPSAAALADSTANPTVPGVGAYLMGWDGATWNRTLNATAATDNVSENDKGMPTNSRNYVYDGSAWDRIPGNSTDGMTVNLGSNNDITANPPDTDVASHTNYAKKYYTSAGAATDGIIWSPAAGKRWHVVSLIINVSAAATVTLEDDLAAGDSAVWKAELAANSGVAINFSEQYPLASGEDAADLTITTSAGNVYVTCTGYEV